eukprot:12343332-Ditylum_brightwellii.AAC.1
MIDTTTKPIQTVEENKVLCTHREVKSTEQARQLMAMTGRPLMQNLINLISSNLVKNCPVTTQDIRTADKIFGKDVGLLKGKTTRSKPESVSTHCIDKPKELRQLHNKVTVAADLMYINAIPFMVSIARKIKFITIQRLIKKARSELFKAIKNIVVTYWPRDFYPEVMLMDSEFKYLGEALASIGIKQNVTLSKEHVSGVERAIRLIKERVRAALTPIPYTKYLVQMVIEATYLSVFWLNAVPLKSSLSQTLSPKAIVMGREVDFKKHCRIPFSAYTQVNTKPEPTNSLMARTSGAIVLGPGTNLQGGTKFLNLRNGRLINRRAFIELPVPRDIIER